MMLRFSSNVLSIDERINTMERHLYNNLNVLFIFKIYFSRFEISDNGRSEGSEDTLPNETTVKFISEVSSKVILMTVARLWEGGGGVV